MKQQSAKVVLVVDDDADSAETLCELLCIEGYDASHALSGGAALSAVAARRPDAVVLDIGMPDVNGFEVAKAIRASADGHLVRVIALSGYSRPASMIELTEVFDEYLVKPVDFAQLARAIDG